MLNSRYVVVSEESRWQIVRGGRRYPETYASKTQAVCSAIAIAEMDSMLTKPARLRACGETQRGKWAKGPPPPPFQQAISGAPGPGVEPCKREFHPPAEMADQGSKAALIEASQPGFGAKVIDEHDLASRLDHAGELVERGLRIRHRGDHELRHHDIEESIRKAELLRVHQREHLHIGEPVPLHAGLGAAQHRLREVDAHNPIAR